MRRTIKKFAPHLLTVMTSTTTTRHVVGNQTRRLVEQAATELEVAASKAWNLYITGMRIEAALDLLAVASVLGATYIYRDKLRAFQSMVTESVTHRSEPSGEDKAFAWAMTLAVYTLGILLLGIVYIFIQDAVIRLVLPEYAILKDVVRAASEAV